MDFHVSLKGPGDLSARIYRQLLEAVVDGRLRPGERLPPTRDLALRLDVARNTVTIAYERLAAEGFLTSRVGAGSFVRTEPLARVQVRRAPFGADLHARPIWQSIMPPLEVRSAPPVYDFRVGIPTPGCFRSRRGGGWWLGSYVRRPSAP